MDWCQLWPHHVWGKISIYSTQFTLPGDFCFIFKSIVRDAHVVLVAPRFTHITVGHFITFLLGQAADAVKVHWLGVPDTNTTVLTNHWEVRDATLFQAIHQVLPYRPAIILAWILTTANVVCKCYSKDSIIGTIWLPSNVHHFLYKLFSRAGLSTMVAINFTVVLEALEYMLSYTLTSPSSHPTLKTVHQW